MAILRVNIGPEGAEIHGRGRPAGSALARAARQSSGPIIVMVHGWNFEPGHSRHCPHRHIFGLGDTGVTSWPEGLGFDASAQSTGLCVAIGWHARCGLREAYCRAGEAGRMLASVIASLRLGSGGRPVHAIGHSLGVRVILAALPWLDAGDMGRIVALAGAEWRKTALEALATPAGRQAELINVTWRANAAFDLIFARALRHARPKTTQGLGRVDVGPDTGMGAGIAGGLGWAQNRVDLHLDAPGLQALLAARGMGLTLRRRALCHWAGYANPGAMALHHEILRHPEEWPLSLLATRSPSPKMPGLGLLHPA